MQAVATASGGPKAIVDIDAVDESTASKASLDSPSGKPRVAADLSNALVSKIITHFKGDADQVVDHGGPQGRRRLQDFWQKNLPLLDPNTPDDEVFNPDFLVIDRVLAMREADDGSGRMEALVMWCSLPYSHATWEYVEDVDADKVEIEITKFQERQRYHLESRRPVRPPSSDWKKLESSPRYKNDNVLRPWQVEGVSWLQFGWYQRRGCILGDEMGLGKTVQAVALIKHIAEKYAEGPFLVIAPLSTIGHWKRELEQWSDLNTVVCVGSREDREICRHFEWRYWTQDGLEVPNRFKFDVLVCTYESIMAESSDLADVDWRCLIVDEGHRLKNHKSKLFRTLHGLSTEHRVMLTGTPVQNEISELWTLLHFVAQDVFPSRAQFLAKFGSLSSSGDLEKLQAMLSAHLLRRLKEDVAKFLPPKLETIVEIELTQVQKQYYRAVLERNRDFLNKGCDSVAAPRLVNIGMQLRKVCNHPFLISGAEDRITASAATAEQLCEAMVSSSGKLVFVDKLLPRLIAAGSKTLIFSQFKMVLNVLARYMTARGITYERIDGDLRGAERQLAIDRFSSPSSLSRVFLLSTRAGGLGLNLQMATTVIIFDSDWNPQADVQAQARAHRLGQTQDVTVYRLITRRTYEQHMFEVASRKLGLDQALLHGAQLHASSSSDNRTTRQRKEEIDRLLRRGTYDVFTKEADEASRQFCDDDIDTILEQRTKTWTCSAEATSSFSKARFTSSEADTSVSVDAPDFWEQMLPDRSSPVHLLKELKDGLSLETSVDYMDRLRKVYEESRALVDAARLLPVIDLLSKAAESTCSLLTDADRDTMKTWLDELQNPRKRRRRQSSIAAEEREKLKREQNLFEVQQRKLKRTRRSLENKEAASSPTGGDFMHTGDAAGAELVDDLTPKTKGRRPKALPPNRFGSASCSRPEMRVLREVLLMLLTSWQPSSIELWTSLAERVAPQMRAKRSPAELAAITLAFLDICIGSVEDDIDKASFVDRRSALCRVLPDLNAEFPKVNPMANAAGEPETEITSVSDVSKSWFPAMNETSFIVHVECHARRWARLCRLGREVITCLARYETAQAPILIPETGRHRGQQSVKWWNDDLDRALLFGVRRHGIVHPSLEAMYTDESLAFVGALAKLPATAKDELPHLRAVELRARALVVELGRCSSHPMIEDSGEASQDNATAKVRTETTTKWSRRDRTFFCRSLLVYGPGRWALFREKAGLQSKSLQQLEQYYRQFMAVSLMAVQKGKGRSIGDCEAEARLKDRHTYCVCRAPAGAESMLLCNTCTTWFHESCIGGRRGGTRERWSCPRCRAAGNRWNGSKKSSAGDIAAGSSSGLTFVHEMKRPVVSHPMPLTWREACAELIESMMKEAEAEAFLKPVDAAAVEGYAAAIRCPMDLSSIKESLLSDGYGRPDEMAEDFRLMARNCSQFNTISSELSESAMKLLSTFEERFDKMCHSEVFSGDGSSEVQKLAELDPEIEVSPKMAAKVLERIRAFDDVRKCMELTREERQKRLETASSRWMPPWWKSVRHDLALVESAMQVGFGVQPPGFITEEDGADENGDRKKFLDDFFGDRGPLIRRFRYAAHWILYNLDPNSRAARHRCEQGLPPLQPSTPSSKASKKRRRSVSKSAAEPSETSKSE